MIVIKRNMGINEAIKTANDNIDEYLPYSARWGKKTRTTICRIERRIICDF